MKTIGITGGIGSGKSMISQVLEIFNIPVYNSDINAKKITETSPVIKEKLIHRFGPSLYSEGYLNKSLLAALIFKDSSQLAFVNSIIHPEVFKDFLRWKNTFLNKKMIGIESAILFESDLNKMVDICISVSAPQKTRIKRIIKRDGVNRETVLNRIKNQITEEKRNMLSDYIIINDDNQAVIPQVEIILSKLNFQEFA